MLSGWSGDVHRYKFFACGFVAFNSRRSEGSLRMINGVDEIESGRIDV